MGKKILFVCTGNTCRSSMAQAIAAKLILEQRDKYDQFHVTSAGTHALAGMPASGHSIMVSKEAGIDLEEHRSQPITPQLLEEADIILTMTNSHKQQIINLAPQVAGKTFLLKQYTAGEIGDIDKKAQEIYAQIQEKQNNFYQQHKEEIQLLEKKKLQLEKQLESVVNEIGRWEALFFQETYQQQQELEELEEKLVNLEVVDPYGQPVEIYRKCFQELFQEVEDTLEKLVENPEEN